MPRVSMLCVLMPFSLPCIRRCVLRAPLLVPAAMQEFCSLEMSNVDFNPEDLEELVPNAPRPTMAQARDEFEIVMFTTIQDLLDKTGEPLRVHGLVHVRLRFMLHVISCNLLVRLPLPDRACLNKQDSPARG